MKTPAPIDPWPALRRLTPARIGLERSGNALATAEVLRFGLAHARARDAVHRRLDAERLAVELGIAGISCLRVHSAAPDRQSYLLRPDLGRRLAAADREALLAKKSAPADLCLVIADGLSAAAAQGHALPLLEAFRRRTGKRWRQTSLVIAEQARVALGDEVGEALAARLVAVLIGERPGLSSPDSLGVYLTWNPRVGRTDAERNCISNIRPEGLGYEEAARRLAWLAEAAMIQERTGVELKDRSDEPGPLP